MAPKSLGHIGCKAQLAERPKLTIASMTCSINPLSSSLRYPALPAGLQLSYANRARAPKANLRVSVRILSHKGYQIGQYANRRLLR